MRQLQLPLSAIVLNVLDQLLNLFTGIFATSLEYAS